MVVLRKGERIPERREQEEGHPIMKMGMRQPLSGHFFFILRKGAGIGVLVETVLGQSQWQGYRHLMNCHVDFF